MNAKKSYPGWPPKITVNSLICAAIVVLASAQARAAEPMTAIGAHGQNCGWERWAVKTGQDSGVAQVKPAVQSTVKALVSMTSPLPKQTSKYPPQINHRLGPFEFEQVTISATITMYRSEADSDIHLVITDGKRTMIAEIPCSCCLDNLAGVKGMAASPWVAQIAATRAAFLVKTGYVPVAWVAGKTEPPWVKCNIPVTLTGAVFFDWPHRQPGAAAKNAVELHPVLSIAFGS